MLQQACCQALSLPLWPNLHMPPGPLPPGTTLTCARARTTSGQPYHYASILSASDHGGDVAGRDHRRDLPESKGSCDLNSIDPVESTVIVVEDDRHVRESLETLLTAADYHCLAFASSEAFLGAQLPPPPRCLLLDLQLGGQSGLELQGELNARQTPLPVLFLSGDNSITHAVSAMKAGAMDFLQKPFEPALLLSRVEQALQASAEGIASHASADHDAALLAELTQREYEILELLVDGSTNKEVARQLGISTRTVETHRTHIMTKLEAHTLADVVRTWLNSRS